MIAARPSVVCLALLLFACASGEPERGVHDLSRDRDPSTGVDVPASPGDSGSPTSVDPGPCGALQASAQRVLESHQTCSVDQDCRDGAIVAPCPAPASCRVFVRKDTDLLWSELAQLEAKFRASCGKCAAAKCGVGEPTRAFCDATKHCAAHTLPPSSRDASTPSTRHDAGLAHDASASSDASSDASSARSDASVDSSPGANAQADAGVDAAFACKVNLDCVVTNVGNCCGYYPRCANVNATFAPPSCTGGQVGVCGFPNIDSCECRANLCVSLQGGKPI